jgi:hypothetical protein
MSFTAVRVEMHKSIDCTHVWVRLHERLRDPGNRVFAAVYAMWVPVYPLANLV